MHEKVMQNIEMEELTLTSDHVSNLNDGVNVGFGENAFTTSTFDIKTEDA